MKVGYYIVGFHIGEKNYTFTVGVNNDREKVASLSYEEKLPNNLYRQLQILSFDLSQLQPNWRLSLKDFPVNEIYHQNSPGIGPSNKKLECKSTISSMFFLYNEQITNLQDTAWSFFNKEFEIDRKGVLLAYLDDNRNKHYICLDSKNTIHDLEEPIKEFAEMLGEADPLYDLLLSE